MVVKNEVTKTGFSRVVELATTYGVPLLGLACIVGIEMTVGNKMRKADALLHKAVDMENGGLFLEALITYKYASMIDPLSADILSGLGRMYIIEGELDAAHDVVNQLFEVSPCQAEELQSLISN